ncbi:MAG: PhzF family phenazine biosynthesis isomerase [Rhizobiales bacterium]|nr:PhzF family phenazine biosynthesis isomerase [Hyphomicrobiales bacterium]
MTAAHLVNVFTYRGQGGNPCPVVADASALSAEGMQAVAQHYGHESGFVLPASSLDYDFAFRFWVPRHEMEMCGHATIGALWTLARTGALKAEQVRIETRSGPVTGYVDFANADDPAVEITQPAGKVVPLSRNEEEDVLATLRITRSDLLDLPLQNAVTSRVKTLIPMKTTGHLDALMSEMKETEACCTRIGSTGLYPYAIDDHGARLFEARQFPKSSGYPEDAATGIAAAALAFGLLGNGLVEPLDRTIHIRQGRAMGRLSEIRVRLGFAAGRPIGCLLGGSVSWNEADATRPDTGEARA